MRQDARTLESIGIEEGDIQAAQVGGVAQVPAA